MEVSSCSSVYVGTSVVNVCDSQVPRMETLVTFSYSHPIQYKGEKGSVVLVAALIQRKLAKGPRKMFKLFV